MEAPGLCRNILSTFIIPSLKGHSSACDIRISWSDLKCVDNLVPSIAKEIAAQPESFFSNVYQTMLC